MTTKGYPLTGNRYWKCPSCKEPRRGEVCKVCLVKREDALRPPAPRPRS